MLAQKCNLLGLRSATEEQLASHGTESEAHTALGRHHAEIIDTVGGMIGGLAYGAKRDVTLNIYQTTLKLHPDSAIACVEYANDLMKLEGKKALKKALKQAGDLYAEAAECEPLDAMERLDVELAKLEPED